MKPIRVSAKAVIIEDGRILLLSHEDRDGEWYSLPGGGQENGETLEEALIRECREEINAAVRVKDVLFIRDYIAVNHEFKDEEASETHQVEIMFECSVDEPYLPVSGEHPDATQKSVLWVGLERLPDSRFYPAQMRDILTNISAKQSKIYLGDIN
jgi:ADP-ribose pyrophosphatase YjhB (NUDIX family)